MISKLNSKLRGSSTQLFISAIIALIIAIYYMGDLRPFAYAGFTDEINKLQLLNAQLNTVIIEARFGLAENTSSKINETFLNMYKVLDRLKKQLIAHPNSKIQQSYNEIELTIQQKVKLTEEFNAINPKLNETISQFIAVFEPILDNEQNNLEIEGSYNVKSLKPSLLNKANELFRKVLIYVGQNNLPPPQDVPQIVNFLKNSPEQFSNMPQVYPLVETILDLQPKIIGNQREFSKFVLTQKLSTLSAVYQEAYEKYLKTSYFYHIVLYVLALLLILVLRWAFKRLQNTVDELIIAQSELAKTNRELEQRVADRTAELTIKNKDLSQAIGDLKDAQEQLIMQEKMASVGMLTTGIAHEIKNPLNFVNNFSDISIELTAELGQELESNKASIKPEALTYIQEILNDLKTNCTKIKEHGVRADNIVKTMLMHSQEESVQKELIDLNTVMNDSMQVSLESFKTKTPNFDPKITTTLACTEKILGAPQSLGRVFMYIIDNALYAINEKREQTGKDFPMELTIEMVTQDNQAIIKIKDNGVGIPKKALDKVFEPFFTTKPTGRGNTGLGLSICFDIIVKQHKGMLRVASAENEFTEFTITLPNNLKATE